MTHTSLFAAEALLPSGWATDVLLEWDDAGTLTRVQPDAVTAAMASNQPTASGPLMPGMPNLHSHAFQRAFAGLSEYRSSSSADSFWTWRDLMYRFALAVTPDQLEDIATHLYIEMLRAGYTSVCEFHYLHHDPQGRPYADRAEMAWRIDAAARRAGIGLTLLPVLYQDAGFGGTPPRGDQRRFINSVDALLDIAHRAQAQGVRAGVAPHSLRAVSPLALGELQRGAGRDMPIHIHIAEHQQEVDDCVAWCGQRPVQWLLDHADVDARWCLVHATHMNSAETMRLARSGATAGICPSTEANLGDGCFEGDAYSAAGGAWGIGSDSHVTVDACDELRLFEYSQRLARQQRNVLASNAQPRVADNLWLRAVQGGAAASGRAIGGLVVGQRADLVVLESCDAMAGLPAPMLLATQVFAAHRTPAIRDVWVGGKQRVDAGDHVEAAGACDRFVRARSQLMAEL